MTEPQGPHADVTRLLQEWREGREGALDRLIPLVYNELRVIAARHEALRKLEALDPDQARIVELRFFGGLTVEETAEVVGVSTATVKREWALARGWLYRELNGRDRRSPC